ncbi:hypothetical protein DMUE_0885 [Dictyocoela muelleri]|nr:hypothetical protein DMUE_0885 [Dictyocoela muelleri]
MNGLPKELILKYSELGLYDANSIMKRISETEKLCETFETTSSPSTIQQTKLFRDKPLYKSKWCKLHKSRSHSDQECIVQNKRFGTNDKSKGGINNLETYSLPYLFINSSNDKPLKILIDSCASFSLISDSYCKKLELSKNECQPFYVKLANGSKCVINRYTNICIFDIDNKTNLNFRAHILKDLSEKLIIGSDTIKMHKIILDLSNNIILLNNKSHELNNVATTRILH